MTLECDSFLRSFSNFYLYIMRIADIHTSLTKVSLIGSQFDQMNNARFTLSYTEAINNSQLKYFYFPHYEMLDAISVASSNDDKVSMITSYISCFNADNDLSGEYRGIGFLLLSQYYDYIGNKAKLHESIAKGKQICKSQKIISSFDELVKNK